MGWRLLVRARSADIDGRNTPTSCNCLHPPMLLPHALQTLNRKPSPKQPLLLHPPMLFPRKSRSCSADAPASAAGSCPRRFKHMVRRQGSSICVTRPSVQVMPRQAHWLRASGMPSQLGWPPQGSSVASQLAGRLLSELRSDSSAATAWRGRVGGWAGRRVVGSVRGRRRRAAWQGTAASNRNGIDACNHDDRCVTVRASPSLAAVPAYSAAGAGAGAGAAAAATAELAASATNRVRNDRLRLRMLRTVTRLAGLGVGRREVQGFCGRAPAGSLGCLVHSATDHDTNTPSQKPQRA